MVSQLFKGIQSPILVVLLLSSLLCMPLAAMASASSAGATSATHTLQKRDPPILADNPTAVHDDTEYAFRHGTGERFALKKRVAANVGPACVGAGTPCTYSPTNAPENTVNGFCGPNGCDADQTSQLRITSDRVATDAAPLELPSSSNQNSNSFCAENGAICQSDANCFNYCGTDGICGGRGAFCTSATGPADGVNAFTCHSPGFVCSTDEWGGACLLTPSTLTRMRRRHQSKFGQQAQAQAPVKRTLTSRSKSAIMANVGEMQAH